MRACKLDDTGRQFIPYYDVPVMQLHEIDDNTGRSGVRGRPRAAGVWTSIVNYAYPGE